MSQKSQNWASVLCSTKSEGICEARNTAARREALICFTEYNNQLLISFCLRRLRSNN